MRRVLIRARAMRRHRRLLAVLATFVVVLLGFGSGAAYAYFSSNGNGSGTASTGQPLTVHVVPATATPTNTLIPGGTSDIAMTLDNPNSYAVTISGVQGNGSGPDAGDGCTASNAGVTVATLSNLSIAVAPGSSVEVTIPDAASMSTSSATACQGKHLDLPVLLTVHK